MTPERLALLQDLITRHDFGPWTANDIRRIREPVCFQPRHGTKNVFDFPRVQWIYCTLRRDKVQIFDSRDIPLTPHYDIVWIEAEGVVITAHALDAEGDDVAESMVGMDCPLYRAERKRLKQERRTRQLMQKLEARRT